MKNVENYSLIYDLLLLEKGRHLFQCN